MEMVKKDISNLSLADDEIDRWHAEGHKVSLIKFLGMTEEEYQIFVKSQVEFEEYIKRTVN
jgi:hypothetical protein